MSAIRSSRSASMATLAALALILAAVAPVFGARTGPDAPGMALAQPEECEEITIDAEGAIVVGDVTLSEADVDADVLAVLALAAAAEAAGMGWDAVCVDMETAGEAVVVNAEIGFCPASVEVRAEGSVSLRNIDVPAELLTAELLSLLQGAAALEEEACLHVRVEDNEVLVGIEVHGCVTATRNENQTVTVVMGGIEVELPADAFIDLDGQLEVGLATETQLWIFAEAALETGEPEFQVGIAEFHFCADPTSGQVIVEKRLDDGSGPGTPAGSGWTFDFAITGGEVVEASPTTGEEGVASFTYRTEPGAAITVTEQPRDGYRLADRACIPISDGGEPLAPVGVWTGASVTFPAEPGVRTVCIFLNGPTAPAPSNPATPPAPTNPPPAAPTTAAPTTAAPTGGHAPQGQATERPRITLPPTDGRVSGIAAVSASPWFVLVTLGLVIAGSLLLTASRRPGG